MYLTADVFQEATTRYTRENYWTTRYEGPEYMQYAAQGFRRDEITFRILAPLQQYGEFLFGVGNPWLPYLYLARELAHDVVLVDWPNRDDNWLRAQAEAGEGHDRNRMGWELDG